MPRTADYMLQAVSRLFSWARGRGLTKAEPTKDLERLYESIRTEQDIQTFRKTAPQHLIDAVELAAYSGLRQGDLLRLKGSQVTDLSIAFRTRKKGRLAIVPLIEPARVILKRLLADGREHPFWSTRTVSRGLPAASELRSAPLRSWPISTTTSMICEEARRRTSVGPASSRTLRSRGSWAGRLTAWSN